MTEVESEGRRAEAAVVGAAVLREVVEGKVERVHPKKYSRKYQASKTERDKSKESKFQCFSCGRSRCDRKNCPAKTSKCNRCGRKGHWARSVDCRQSEGKPHIRRDREKARYVNGESSEERDQSTSAETESGSELDGEQSREGNIRRARIFKVRDDRPFRMAERKKGNKREYKVQVAIKGMVMEVNTDTGADINVMPEEEANRLKLPLQKTRLQICPYGGRPFRAIGKYEGTTTYGDDIVPTVWYVVKKKLEPLLSGGLAEKLGIIIFNPDREEDISHVNSVTRRDNQKLQQYRKRFPRVFEGIGTLRDYEVHLHIDESVRPIAEPPQPIPFHLRKRYNDKIEVMIKEGVLEEHTGPAPWVSNVVLAPKDDGDIRITVDMRNANKAIKPTNIPIPRVEDIKCQLTGCQFFSKLDLKLAFHQLTLDEKSRYITVFNSDGRLLRHTKLTMGNTVAGGELNKAIRQVLANIEHVYIIHDDIIIAAHTQIEHDMRVDRILGIMQESGGLTLNPEKCQFDVK